MTLIAMLGKMTDRERLSTHEPTKLKVKLGKISEPDQAEIRKLVSRNKEYIYQEWKDE